MFKKGSMVYWSSQAAGSLKTKEGVVAEVVPPGKKPSMIDPKLCGEGRASESYVVKCGSKYYWPLVSKLISDEKPSGPSAEPKGEKKMTSKMEDMRKKKVEMEKARGGLKGVSFSLPEKVHSVYSDKATKLGISASAFMRMTLIQNVEV